MPFRRPPSRAGAPASHEASALVAREAEPFDGLESAALEPLLGRIGGARVVLIGEASHGTSEFYRMRARITQELIVRGRVRFVALEADWPDAAQIDAWVRDEPLGEPGSTRPFSRFPTWMWRNAEVLAFVDWLRDWNGHRDPADRVAVRGLDLYSLGESLGRVLSFLEEADPELARTARDRYGCLSPYATDPALYGYAAWTSRHDSCEDEAVAVLRDLLERRVELVRRGDDGEELTQALGNARVVAGAERYYRTMYQGGAASWNLRDEHMFDTLVRLLDLAGPTGGAVVWAHNSHLGDASATEMSARGELNVGQLVRQRFADDAYLVGFGTHTGTVAAAHEWDGPVQIMNVRPSRPDSYEHVAHESGLAGALVPLRHGSMELRDALAEPRLERAIGVIYRPRTERQSHYFEARLPDQFDEYIWIDESSAVTPLPGPSAPSAGHPFATLDA